MSYYHAPAGASPLAVAAALIISVTLAGAAGVGLVAVNSKSATAAAATPATAAAPIAAAPSPSPAPSAADTAVVPARPAPPLILTDQAGKPFDLAGLRGTPALVFFGYTHCPDVCPTRLADARDALKQSATPFAIVFVTIDPERDTPAAMGTYLSYYGIPVTGLSGTPTEIRVAADAWGIRYARIDEGSTAGYAMAHTADAYLVDGSGMLRNVFPFGAGADVIAAGVARLAAEPNPTPGVAAASPAIPTPGGATPSPGSSAEPAQGGRVTAKLMSTVVRAGQNRLVLEVAFPVQAYRYENGKWVLRNDGQPAPWPRPDVTVSMAVRSVDRPADPEIAATARFVWIETNKAAAYTVDLAFPTAGRYVAALTADSPSGSVGTGELPISVKASAPVIAVGDTVPAIDTPTAADVGGDLARISTDAKPFARFYEQSIADARAAGRPFVLVLYSPTFCPNTECGPLLENIKVVARDFPDFTFLHVEPYVMEDRDGRLQPVVENGRFKWSPWSVAYGIPIEPWVFVVGADGRVVTSYELIVGTDELRAAIRSVTATQ